MIVGCTRALPPAALWVSRSEPGAVAGAISRQGGRKADPIDLPMRDGDAYGVISPHGAMFVVAIDHFALSIPRPDYLHVKWAWPGGEVDEEAARRFERARIGVGIHMIDDGDDPVETARYAYRLGDRLAALSGGCTNDFFARRFFAPGGWKVPDAGAGFEAREHVSLYAHELHDGMWFRTHGLVKFGRPELEIYRVTGETAKSAVETLGNFVDYVVSEQPVEPGHTLGNRQRPLLARPGSRDPAYWEGTPVLELVDVDRNGSPFPSGANHGLAAMTWKA